MKRVVPIITLLLLTGWTLSFNRVLLKGEIEVDSEDSDMVLRWEATVEEGIEKYEIWHKTSLMPRSSVVGEVEARGPNYPYRFVDSYLFKATAEQVDYELWAVFENRERELLTQVTMNYTPTTVRRTWGSIKAMFQ